MKTIYKISDLRKHALWQNKNWIIIRHKFPSGNFIDAFYVKNENKIVFDIFGFPILHKSGSLHIATEPMDCEFIATSNLPKYIRKKMLFYFKIWKILP